MTPSMRSLRCFRRLPLSPVSGCAAGIRGASVKKSAPAVAGKSHRVHIDSAMVSTAPSHESYIECLPRERLSGSSPTGCDRELHIAAKLPEGATRAQLPEMIQSLLAESSAGAARDKKEFPSMPRWRRMAEVEGVASRFQPEPTHVT